MTDIRGRVSRKESSVSMWNVNRTPVTGRMFGADRCFLQCWYDIRGRI